LSGEEAKPLTGAEKRGAPRAEADFVVEMYELDGRTLIGIARLLNLSATGACVESTSVLVDKAGIVIRLLLGKRHLLTLPGGVMWIRVLPHTRQYGLRFGAYPENAKGLIVKFVQEYFSELGGDVPQPPAA
jgi:hypothetical protein